MIDHNKTMQKKKKFWFFIHDVIIHPICGILWILGLDKWGDWLHDITVNEVNYGDETWSPEDMKRK